MEERDSRVELLAPAGSAESFYGAIHAGADAVYLGGERFGARAFAENFSTQELVACIRYGHLCGRRIYLTVNTLLKEEEMGGLYDYLSPLEAAGLDAVIVQDLGVLRFVREHFPRLRIHASTQMTLCAGEGARLLKELGADRVIPARELSLKEIADMKRLSGIEIETFIHGAMCYCYSGQCLFSSILGGRSGNRGRCAQPCRLPYSVRVGGARREDCYPLSLKDMCVIGHIPELIEAGIDSFKIEGRMKKPEYAAGTTDIYRRSIDRYYQLRERFGVQEAARRFQVEQADLDALSALYVRSGLQDGYYFRHNGKEMITLDSPAYSGSDEELLEKIREKFLKSPEKLPVSTEAAFRVGQPAKLTLRWGRAQASVEGAPVERAQSRPVTEENLRKQLGKLGDSAFLADQIRIVMDEDCFYPLGQVNELRRAAVAALEEQILRVRGYEGEGEDRRKKAAEGTSVECDPATGERAAVKENAAEGQVTGLPGAEAGFAFYVRTGEQLQALVDWLSRRQNPSAGNGRYSPCDALPHGTVRIYVDSDLLNRSDEEILSLCRELSRQEQCALYVALPYILREGDRGYLENVFRKVRESGIFEGFLARSMDGLGFLAQRRGNHMSCRVDAGVYIWNGSAARELADLAEGFCLPYELKASEQRKLMAELSRTGLAERFPWEKIVYGRIPMMITANCLNRTLDRCGRSPKAPGDGVASPGQGAVQTAVLKDRYRKEFPVLVNCRNCTNIIYNSVPFSLHQELSKWRGRMDLRMDFTLESAAEVEQLLDCFFAGAPFPQADYTTGHEKRGVE